MSDKKWCAMCAKYTDHQSGSCPQLRPHRELASSSCSEYPRWICSDCGIKYGGRKFVPWTHLGTWHHEKCDICGSVEAVTQPRDYGHLKEGWREAVTQNGKDMP